MVAQTINARTVARVLDSVRTVEGGGFMVRRPFPTTSLSHLDPFLLLDEMGPMDVAPGEARGAPDHPHRGFETVTYMISGRMEHRDSQGNSGSLGPGDVQWMTAGAGVVHSEMPAAEFQRTGGRMHGFQLWVNLPRGDKMIRPRYQEVPASRIPIARTADGLVKVAVIAGEALGVRAVIDTRTPIMYLRYTLQPGARVSQAVPREYNAFAYIVDGSGVFDAEGRRAADGQTAIFAGDGDQVLLQAPSDAPLEVLLIAGAPLREPIARYGPFVMNTQDEVLQAFKDYRDGRMGAIAPA